MDQFTVPKFVEHEAKIVGPLTFKQFIYIGIAGAICFIFYFLAPFYIFILVTLVVMVAGTSLAFLKSGGRDLPTVLKNFFSFSFAPKTYLWKKKGGLPPKIIEKSPEEEKKKEDAVPAIASKSRLNNLSSQIEVKTKEEPE